MKYLWKDTIYNWEVIEYFWNMMIEMRYDSNKMIWPNVTQENIWHLREGIDKCNFSAHACSNTKENIGKNLLV